MMSECFKELDADKSGTVDVRELLEAVEMVDMHEADDSRSMRANIERIMADLDQDQNGEMTLEELLAMAATGAAEASSLQNADEVSTTADSLPLLLTAFTTRRQLQRKLGTDFSKLYAPPAPPPEPVPPGQSSVTSSRATSRALSPVPTGFEPDAIGADGQLHRYVPIRAPHSRSVSPTSSPAGGRRRLPLSPPRNFKVEERKIVVNTKRMQALFSEVGVLYGEYQNLRRQLGPIEIKEEDRRLAALLSPRMHPPPAPPTPGRFSATPRWSRRGSRPGSVASNGATWAAHSSRAASRGGMSTATSRPDTQATLRTQATSHLHLSRPSTTMSSHALEDEEEAIDQMFERPAAPLAAVLPVGSLSAARAPGPQLSLAAAAETTSEEGEGATPKPFSRLPANAPPFPEAVIPEGLRDPPRGRFPSASATQAAPLVPHPPASPRRVEREPPSRLLPPINVSTPRGGSPSEEESDKPVTPTSDLLQRRWGNGEAHDKEKERLGRTRRKGIYKDHHARAEMPPEKRSQWQRNLRRREREALIADGRTQPVRAWQRARLHAFKYLRDALGAQEADRIGRTGMDEPQGDLSKETELGPLGGLGLGIGSPPRTPKEDTAMNDWVGVAPPSKEQLDELSNRDRKVNLHPSKMTHEELVEYVLTPIPRTDFGDVDEILTFHGVRSEFPPSERKSPTPSTVEVAAPPPTSSAARDAPQVMDGGAEVMSFAERKAPPMLSKRAERPQSLRSVAEEPEDLGEDDDERSTLDSRPSRGTTS